MDFLLLPFCRWVSPLWPPLHTHKPTHTHTHPPQTIGHIHDGPAYTLRLLYKDKANPQSWSYTDWPFKHTALLCRHLHFLLYSSGQLTLRRSCSFPFLFFPPVSPFIFVVGANRRHFGHTVTSSLSVIRGTFQWTLPLLLHPHVALRANGSVRPSLPSLLRWWPLWWPLLQHQRHELLWWPGCPADACRSAKARGPSSSPSSPPRPHRRGGGRACEGSRGPPPGGALPALGLQGLQKEDNPRRPEESGNDAGKAAAQ